ncbi:hypothetical protein ABDD95_14595 [Mucilaginibacter sp. PAMB04274]|uniref:hypothetical protein n=1 Tax=Mucilaginibacter sp. PAMB04274 TaxID=3138568 RepID=UPI0031F6DD13
MVVQVNDELELHLTALKLSIQNGDSIKVIYADYAPGRLIVNETDGESVLDASKVILTFDHYAYPKGNQTLDNLKVTFSSELFKQRYLIINFYVFSDKRYKHWYKMNDDQEFAVNLTYPNSGILVRKK